MLKKLWKQKCRINSMKLKPLFLLALLILTSCGGSKSIPKLDSNTTAKQVINFHKAANPDFKTLASRVQLLYQDNHKTQSITVSLRMEKDKTIWIKASILGITLAKVLITPIRVSYYETLGRTYFEGDFALLGEWLGTSINFQQAQSLLLGQSIFTLNPSDYSSEVFQNKFKIQPKLQPQNFIHSLLMNPDNFKIASESLSQPTDGRLLNVRYGNYQKIEDGYFPLDITINTTENPTSPRNEETKTKIEMNFKKIDLNVSVSFPFNIPNGYEEIHLN